MMYYSKQEKNKRAIILRAIFSVIILSVFARAFWLQTVHDERLEKLAHRQFKSKITALPRRGLILDRNGEGLAISMKAHSLFLRPNLFEKTLDPKQRALIIKNISQITKIPTAHIQTKIKNGKSFIWIKRQLTPAEENDLRNRGLLDYENVLGLVEETRRSYPNAEVASHILGAVNVDGQGLEGLELYYNAILSGQTSRISSEKDAMGRRIFEDEKGILAIKDGQSLLLTIDKSIQYETEKILAQYVSNLDAKAASAIVADVQTGDILAIANVPTFNPNDTNRTNLDRRRNRAITDMYEPGSTFKPFLVAQALEKGKSPKNKVYCERGSFRVGDRVITEAEAHEKYEWLSYSDILKYSSNIGAAKIALDLGPASMSQLFDRLQMGTKTGIDLPGEASGISNRTELKSNVRLANVGFGHGIMTTPIQMLGYYLALANKGTWIQPKLVKAVISEDLDSIENGEIRWKLGTLKKENISKQLFSEKNANAIKSMLETVMDSDGTGRFAQLEEWPVAGKTGTAQKIDPSTKKYSRTKFISSFAGFAPSKNPKLVALVVIDEPKRKYYASETAAPTFAEIMKSALLREGVPTNNESSKALILANRSQIHDIENSAIAKQPQLTVKESNQKAIQHLTNEVEDPNRILVPDLAGYSIREAIKWGSDKNINIEFLGSGILKSQNIPPNTVIESGSKLTLKFEQK